MCDQVGSDFPEHIAVKLYHYKGMIWKNEDLEFQAMVKYSIISVLGILIWNVWRGLNQENETNGIQSNAQTGIRF